MDKIEVYEKIYNSSLSTLLEWKKSADEAYFNSGSPIITDDAYDSLCRRLQDLNIPITEVGCLPKKEKIQLPIYMGSLNKYNDNKTINNFLNKYDYKSFVVHEKLDGVSCLLVSKNGGSDIKLYTRGNGTTGTDITHLLSHGLHLPQITHKQNFMVRGELIVTKNIFSERFVARFKNIRNMVSGQLTKKNPDKSIISCVDFITYEVIRPYLETQNSMVEQCKFLKENNFKVVYHRIIGKEFLDKDILQDYLMRRKKKSDYEIDGLVITINDEYTRNHSDNPKYSFAFKIQGNTADAKVEYVKWNLSKSGKYKPQIFIHPVELSGVTISSLTGFNAKYIVSNKISRGSTLRIMRSGDVIPHIIAVLTEGIEDVVLPEHSKWNSVELYHNFEETPDDVIIKQMVYFFTSLNCLNCKDKTILKIYNSGYKTIESIIQAHSTDLAKIEGIGEILSNKLLTTIKMNIIDASLHELLAALNSFGEGIGLKKIQNIDIQTFNNWLENKEINLHIKGLSHNTINQKILPVWKESLDRVKNIKRLVNGGNDIENNYISRNNSGPFKNKIFVFTGFRDTALEKQIIELGGKVTSSVSKKTTDLIVASEANTKISSKLIKSQNLGIRITTKSKIMNDIKNMKLSGHKVEIDYDTYESSEEDI
jgi:DNA ligase (NAD+)